MRIQGVRNREDYYCHRLIILSRKKMTESKQVKENEQDKLHAVRIHVFIYA